MHNEKKESYLSDKSNYIYHLSIQDTVSAETLSDGIDFPKYKDILEKNGDMTFYKGFDRSPDMIGITSLTDTIGRLQTFIFDDAKSDLTNTLTKLR